MRGPWSHANPLSKVFVATLIFTFIGVTFGTGGVWSQSEQTRISCFLLGKVHPKLCPFTAYFDEDPLFIYAVEPIPSGLNDQERRKYDRLYYPRSRKVLLDSYDMIFFSDARIQHFSPRQFHDLDYAFREAGMPSFYSFGPAWVQAFHASILHDVIPIDLYDFHFHTPFRVIFRRERDPVFLPFVELGIQNVRGTGWGWMTAKLGATIWADMVPMGYPWLISWKPGGSNPGEAWVCADEFNLNWWGLSLGARNANPYAIDLTTNLVLYSLDRPLIDDIHARRQARYLLSSYRTQKLTVIHMLEWADSFGANTLSLSGRLGQLDENTNDALDDYLAQEYSSSVSLMQSISPRITEIVSDAVELKDQALFWVYVIEWSVVTSAGILAGILVWVLMVRRAVYKAVLTTKTRAKQRIEY